ncbi:MAG: selenide, water dikinase SelD [Gammaproteobacteria bacterium]|nr:selenide, water dikinase SelD [Gammaproteobacteria bacterium]
MHKSSPTLATKSLVLLGGGHSHLSVLMELAKKPVPGLEVTLVTRDVDTPYSGALPAYIMGTCGEDDLYIDLRPLAQMAGARLIHASVERIDLETRQLHCAGRPALGFDMLSINIGSRPATGTLPGAEEFAVAVKPIPEFLQQWGDMQHQAMTALREGRPYTLAVVGGGPASVELACAMQTRLLDNARASSETPAGKPLDATTLIRVVLLTSSASLVTSHNAATQTRAMQTLRSKSIKVHLQHSVKAIERDTLLWEATGDAAQTNTETSGRLHADSIVIATGATAPAWLQQTGLALDVGGFIRVNQSLQSVSHPEVFAAGDIASIDGFPRPRSGVYAVRHGMPLADNLRRYAQCKTLRKYTPQQDALALLNTGDGAAIATRGQWSWQGRWVGVWKDWIDRRFVAKYRDLPGPVEGESGKRTWMKKGIASEARSHRGVRCAGCGGKVGSAMLQQVLQQVHPCTHTDVISTHLSTEDCAMIHIDETRVLLQTVDHFRAFINDPYLFARIATVHCLSDIHAMGATAHSALAIVSVPYAAPHLMQARLLEIMTGCTEVLNAHDTALIGGHTSEAEELSFGLSVNGFVPADRLLRKTGVREGDVLILCKPLGTGTLFAADMRWQARQRWISNALEHMQQSNQLAAQALVRHGATACTDITGFGLLGHLREMIDPEGARVSLSLSALPVLDGALTCIERGLLSSLHPENAQHGNLLVDTARFVTSPRLQLLYDPQTAGGLLASVPATHAEACLVELQGAGYRDAVAIGTVLTTSSSAAAVQLVD